jgi:hypothetical protein
LYWLVQGARLRARSDGSDSPDASGSEGLSPEKFVEQLFFSVLLTPTFAAAAVATIALAWYVKWRATEAERVVVAAREQAERLELEAKKVQPLPWEHPPHRMTGAAGGRSAPPGMGTCR